MILKNQNQSLVSCLQCPGTSAMRETHLTMASFLDSSGSDVQGAAEVPWKTPCQLKKPFMGPRGSCWEERRRIVSPRRGFIDLASWLEAIIFHLSGHPLIAWNLQPEGAIGSKVFLNLRCRQSNILKPKLWVCDHTGRGSERSETRPCRWWH